MPWPWQINTSANTDNMGKLYCHGFCFCSCLRDKLVMFPHPDSLICTQFKFCTGRNFWLRDSMYRDRCATAFDQISAPWLKSGPNQLVPRPRQNAIKFVHGQQKHVPYPPCTGRNLRLKYQDPARCLRRVTQPPHIAGPLCEIKIKNNETDF